MKRPLQFSFIIFLSLVLGIAHGQSTKIDLGAKTVVSLNGLNIRSAPNLKAKKVGAIPFLAKVTYESEQSFGQDTIGKHRYYNAPNDYYDAPIAGDWVKINYQGTIGYVFNAYLFDTRSYFKPPSDINKDFALNLIGQDCQDNLQRDLSLQWFACTSEEGQLTLRKTKISYYTQYDEDIEINFLHVSTPNNKNIAFLVADAKGVLREGKISGKYADGPEAPNYFLDYQTQEIIYKSEDIQVTKEGDFVQLTLIQNGKQQILNPATLELPWPSHVVFRGDIDRDNKTDYMIQYSEDAARLVLYLSSAAKGDELVRAVAMHFQGYCC